MHSLTHLYSANHYDDEEEEKIVPFIPTSELLFVDQKGKLIHCIASYDCNTFLFFFFSSGALDEATLLYFPAIAR